MGAIYNVSQNRAVCKPFRLSFKIPLIFHAVFAVRKQFVETVHEIVVRHSGDVVHHQILRCVLAIYLIPSDLALTLCGRIVSVLCIVRIRSGLFFDIPDMMLVKMTKPRRLIAYLRLWQLFS
jgi:hypothetical protein